MPIRFPSLRGVLKWPPTATAVIATSGLVIALVAVSRRIWRGGGKKAKDPDGTSPITQSRESLYEENKAPVQYKKSLDSIEPIEVSKGQRILEQREEPLNQRFLEVKVKNKPYVLLDKPHLKSKVVKDTGETVTSKNQTVVFTETNQSQFESSKKTQDSELTELLIGDVLKEELIEQVVVAKDLKSKAADKDKRALLTESPESQLKGAKIEATTQEELRGIAEKSLKRCEGGVGLGTQGTTHLILTARGEPIEVNETCVKTSSVNLEAESIIEKSSNLLSNGVEDFSQKKKVDTVAYLVNGVIPESISFVKTADSLSTLEEPENIILVEKICENSLPPVATDDLRQDKLLQSVGKGDKFSELNGSVDTRTEVVELYNSANSIPQSKSAVVKSTSNPSQSTDTPIISCVETCGKSSETKSKPFNQPLGASQKPESNSVFSPNVEQSVKLVNGEDSISPIDPLEKVTRDDSVIINSEKTLVVQVESLDCTKIAKKELEDCSASFDAVKEGVKVVDPVVSGAEKSEIEVLKSSYVIESNHSQLKDSSAAAESVEALTAVENQSSEVQHIPSDSSESCKHLSNTSVESPRAERSLVILLEEEKGVESKQVTVGSVFPEDCGQVSVEEVVTPKERQVVDLGVSEEGKAECGEEVERQGGGSGDGEVTLVAVGGAAEPATCLEEITKVCSVGSGDSALGDQVEGGSVLPDITTAVGLAEVEVCPAVKGLPKALEREDIKPENTVPSKGEEESVDCEVTSSPSGAVDMLTKGAEAKSDMVKAKSTGGKKKGKRVKKALEEEVVKMVEKMEVKDIVRESEASILQNGDVGEDHCGKSSQVDASGISSPSIPNYPDNRSEGSSCGDSGKGRSDVTTPGGLEEDLREVSFSHHFSPPCSTSGPDEDEEERVRRASGSTAEDESRGETGSTIGGEEIMGDSAVVVGSDGLVMPVPVALYPGMVPVTPPPSVYEFVIPQGLVGRLIGKHGSFVNLIKARTSATIFIKTHPETNKLKVCAIEGTEEEIQAALDMIREKFPIRRYSSMTLEQVFFLPLPPPTFTLIPDSLPLHLVEGVSNDVILSALVSPSHYFLQQPTHPTYPTLAKLDMWMAMSYQDTNAPMLPEDVKAGIICAAPTMGGWYRAQIVAVEELPSATEDESVEEGEIIKWCDVRFVDYGGYERLPSHSLRQIRSDFMTLPFQASECYLASVIPAPTSEENRMADGWSLEAYALVEELTQAQVLKAQVVGHATDGLPLVLLYAFSHSYGQVVQVNEELVNRGLAMWVVPVVEADQALLLNEVEEVSGDEKPPEDQPEEAVA